MTLSFLRSACIAALFAATAAAGATEFQVTLPTAQTSLVSGRLLAFTRGLSRELGGKGVTVNLVLPGSVDTEMNPADGPNADFQRSLSALGRFGQPSEIGNIVAFLASPAADLITGFADGGRRLQRLMMRWGVPPRLPAIQTRLPRRRLVDDISPGIYKLRWELRRGKGGSPNLL